ncbi:hypothetical protein GE061_003697 [Apolygus lucorum]|uniref:Uncharacterized protein n=1 Tax=Apolygus lucorum TaxID=248454 RepID=A0A6A4JH87_APOLU|nr:hypothetical protein GE061_003697 [Apolygus lucorum]
MTRNCSYDDDDVTYEKILSSFLESTTSWIRCDHEDSENEIVNLGTDDANEIVNLGTDDANEIVNLGTDDANEIVNLGEHPTNSAP